MQMRPIKVPGKASDHGADKAPDQGADEQAEDKASVQAEDDDYDEAGDEASDPASDKDSKEPPPKLEASKAIPDQVEVKIFFCTAHGSPPKIWRGVKPCWRKPSK